MLLNKLLLHIFIQYDHIRQITKLLWAIFVFSHHLYLFLKCLGVWKLAKFFAAPLSETETALMDHWDQSIGSACSHSHENMTRSYWWYCFRTLVGIFSTARCFLLHDANPCMYSFLVLSILLLRLIFVIWGKGKHERFWHCCCTCL